jgi:predicted phosphodiesterase
MSTTWSDYLLEQFFYYRLGNQVIKPDTYNFYELEYERNGTDYHLAPSVFTNEKTDLVFSSKEYSAGSVPVKAPSSSGKTALRVLVLSDTHDRHLLLNTPFPECDILIHCGDILMTSRKFSTSFTLHKYRQFNEWLGRVAVNIKYRFILGGNHDRLLETLSKEDLLQLFSNGIYLKNESYTIEELGGLRVFGTPYSHGKSGNKAFQSDAFYSEATEAIKNLTQVEEKNIDILVTHGPCRDLRNLVKPRLMHVSGHSHDDYGAFLHQIEENRLVNVCAPIMNHRYEPLYFPIIVDCIFKEV